MQQFIALGFKAVVVCVNGQYLDKRFCGRTLDQEFIDDLPPGVDPCGENGEYHSFVYDGPIFHHPVRFTTGEIVCRTYPAPATDSESENRMDKASYYDFYFCDLIQ
jgi:diphthamide synthase (EF-2-diphthine--ammonia ligase)